MNILEFTQQFSSEEACKYHFKAHRDKQGIICAKCKCTKHYWVSTKWMYECSSCKYRTSLKKGTILEHSKLPFYTWYLIFIFMSATKKGFSAKEVQRQIGMKRYEPVWRAMHKIREAMGLRDDQYKLADMLELDDGFFETSTPESTKKNLKRGRGSQKQTKVLVSAESTPLEDIKTGKKSTSCRYFKMKVSPSFEAKENDQIITALIKPNSVVMTDQSTSYINLSNYVEIHMSEKSSKEVTNTSLKWTHIAISNAKRNFLGVYHKINAKYLQNYLDEFAYKLNRRYFGDRLFDRLVIAISNPVLSSNG